MQACIVLLTLLLWSWVMSCLTSSKEKTTPLLSCMLLYSGRNILFMCVETVFSERLIDEKRSAIFLPFNTESKGHGSGCTTAISGVYGYLKQCTLSNTSHLPMQWQNTKPAQLISGRDTFVVPTSNIRYCETFLQVAPNLFPGLLFCTYIESPNPKN